MFFYVDESGHTGANLFDPEQPILYYGVLSSHVNLDALAGETISQMCQKAKIDRLHAGELGVGGLVPLVPEIVRLQERFDMRFDLYRVAKPDHAIICFFDQVFDQGMNPAVTWTGYWTPLRYMLLVKLATLFDEDTAQKAWAARIEHKDSVAHPLLQDVCRTLHERVDELDDVRSRQLIGDALRWAQQNPDKLSYNVSSAAMAMDVTPNVIGFQFVMSGIARRLRNRRRKAMKIVVDQQSQFNQAQKRLSEWYAKARTVQGLVSGPGLPKLDFRNMPDTPLTVGNSRLSAGLMLTDVYLWTYKRHFEDKALPPELQYLVYANARRGETDEISLNAIASRWSRRLAEIPDPTPEQLERAAELLRADEERRLEAVRELG